MPGKRGIVDAGRVSEIRSDAGAAAGLSSDPRTDGRVRTEGGGRPINVVMNITTPDVQGFRRSESQIAAQLTRALGRGERNR